MLVVRGGRVLRDGRLERGDVVVDGPLIVAGPGPAPADAGRILDAEGLIVAPGFLDLQINGGHGIDLALEPERIGDLAQELPRYGVTAFLPTIISTPQQITTRAIAAVSNALPPRAARPLGLHLEGPMLDPRRRGAHPAQHLRAPALAVVEGWSVATGVALVTLAPELPGALQVIETLRARGVVVAAGHTDASAAQLHTARAAGIGYVTHLYNAMAPFHHREPGVIGATLADASLVAGLIVDGIHVHPDAVAAAWRAKGSSGINLVTDAIGALGRPPGRFSIGASDAVVGPDGSVRLPDGTLAGSTLTLDQALRNLVAFTGCSAAEAIATVTTTPAAVLGLTTKGVIRAGADADLVLLTDDLHVVATVIGGRTVFDRRDRAATMSA
jgi:N-acetylglucosamine-6-phosphate deacetylase